MRPVVVVGVDGTCSGREALRLAATRASVLGARLLAVHVPPPTPVLWSMSMSLAAEAAQWRDDLEEAAFFDTADAADRAGVEWAFTVDGGDVAGVLARQARRRHAALLVVAAGARHRHAHRCPARRLSAAGDVPVLVAAPAAGGSGARVPR
jgi:nucleotide-binding universal stress UspA family protein